MVVAARATTVSGAGAVVLLLLPPAGTAQNSKPHLRLGVGEVEEEEALAGPQVITAGVAAAAEQGRPAPAQTVSALSPTRRCSRQVTGWREVYGFSSTLAHPFFFATRGDRLSQIRAPAHERSQTRSDGCRARF